MSNFRIQSRDLDRRIDIIRDGPATHNGLQNVAGAPVVIGDNLRASHRPGGGQERFANAENAATAPAVFTIRWSTEVATVNAGDRIRYPAGDGGAIYDVKSAIELGRQAGIQIAAVRRVR